MHVAEVDLNVEHPPGPIGETLAKLRKETLERFKQESVNVNRNFNGADDSKSQENENT
jgi:hypothetical protein